MEDQTMEKKMNLVSMLFLFMCVVGFDHFYRGVMSGQQNRLDVKDTVHLNNLNNTHQVQSQVSNFLPKHHQKIAKLK